MKYIASLLAMLAAFSVAPSHRALAQSSPIHYHLLKKVLIGGEGGWDYLTADPEHRKLYIAHGNQVEVYDLDHDSLLAHIANTQGSHGVAIAEREHHGFITCGRSNTVLMFDLRTLDTIKRIPVGEGPDAVTYDLDSHHVFVMNGDGNSVSVLNAETGDVVSTIPLPGNPESAVSDNHGHVFVNLEHLSKIAKISVNENKIVNVWPVAPGQTPRALTMDQGRDFLFIGCGNGKLVVMSSRNGRVMQSFPIGTGVDQAAFDPFTGLAFAACANGTMTIVSERPGNKFALKETVTTQPGARTIAVDPTTHDFYVVSADFGATPAATAEHPHPRPPIVPGTFTLLKFGRN